MTFPIHLTGLAKRAVCATRQPPVHLFSRPERPATCQPRARSTGNGTLPKRKGTHPRGHVPQIFSFGRIQRPVRCLPAATTVAATIAAALLFTRGGLQRGNVRVRLVCRQRRVSHSPSINCDPVENTVGATLSVGSPDINN